jgi:hypothetical protein
VRNSSYLELASGLEIQKAIAYLREDNFPKVKQKKDTLNMTLNDKKYYSRLFPH